MTQEEIRDIRFTEASKVEVFEDLNGLSDYLQGVQRVVVSEGCGCTKLLLASEPSLLIAPLAGPYTVMRNIRWP